MPPERQIKGVVVLREPLGSEIVAHFEVDARPALTEDVRELARDVGQEGSVQAAAEEGAAKTTIVGRFGPRSRIRNGDVIDVAVETSARSPVRPGNRSGDLCAGITMDSTLGGGLG